MRNVRLKTWLALAAAILALVGCRPAGSEKTGTEGEGKAAVLKARVSFSPISASIPLFVALDQGFFAKRGLEVGTNRFVSANEMLDSVKAGQADAVVGLSMVPVLNYEARYPGSIRIFLHSRMTDEFPLDGIIVRSNSAITSVKDLAGRKVAVMPGTTAERSFQAFLLRKQGMGSNAVLCVPLASNLQIPALEAGTVDAVLAYEPSLTIAIRKHGAKQIYGSVYAAMLSPNPIGASIISREFERNNPEAAARLVQALDDAIGSIRANRLAALGTLTNYTKIPAEVVGYVNLQNDTLSSEVNAQTVQAFIDLMVGLGEVPAGKLRASDLLAPTK